MGISKLKKWKINALSKSFLYFGKWNFLAQGLQNSFFRRTPKGISLMLFQVFSFFTIVFRVFSLLIAFFHVTNFASFLLGASFLCWCTAGATDLRELFLLSAVFYLTLVPDIWYNLLLSRFTWEPAVLPWRLQGLRLRFETQTQPICLFESHSVQ